MPLADLCRETSSAPAPRTSAVGWTSFPCDDPSFPLGDTLFPRDDPSLFGADTSIRRVPATYSIRADIDQIRFDDDPGRADDDVGRSSVVGGAGGFVRREEIEGSTGAGGSSRGIGEAREGSIGRHEGA